MESSELQQFEGQIFGRTISIEDGQTYLDRKQGGWTTFPFIIGTILGLSLAAGGWASNLIVFLMNEFNIESIDATQINNIVLGCNNLIPMALAIAGSFFGPFTIIVIFAFVSLLGMIMLTITVTSHSLRPSPCGIGTYTCDASKLQFAVLYMSLTLASLGLGGTRFTLATMGADQFDQANDQGIFFIWYFFALYIANAISFTGIVYIQDKVGWGLGFGICIIVNAIGLATFLLGKGFYRHIKPKGSPFMSIARVIVAAICKRKRSRTLESQEYYHEMPVSAPTRSFRFLNRAALKTEHYSGSDGSYSKSWKLCTVEEVEDLKTLIKIIPLWSTGIFLYATIGMFNSLTILQALNMDRHLGPHKFPAASFLVFNLLATALSIFVIDRLLLPIWQNMTGRSLTPIQRIGIGHVINILGMMGSAIIEARRLHVVRTSVVPMSGLWLVVNLVILGIGEAFHFPGQIALYYQEFPKSLRSTSTVSLQIGIGYYLATTITNLVRRSTTWLPDNINDGRLDNVYWMLTVIGVVNLGYYLICAKLFSYQNVERQGSSASSTFV